MAAAVSALVLLLMLVASLAFLASAEPPASKRSALFVFLTTTPHEQRLGWNASTPACGWCEVTCDTAGSTAVALRLPGISLLGAIPPATIGGLPNLQVADYAALPRGWEHGRLRRVHVWRRRQRVGNALAEWLSVFSLYCSCKCRMR